MTMIPFTQKSDKSFSSALRETLLQISQANQDSLLTTTHQFFPAYREFLKGTNLLDSARVIRRCTDGLCGDIDCSRLGCRLTFEASRFVCERFGTITVILEPQKGQFEEIKASPENRQTIASLLAPNDRDTSLRSIARHLRQHRIPLRSYLNATMRRLVEELRKTPLRILSTVKRDANREGLDSGYPLPLPPKGQSLVSYSGTCSSDIQALREQYPWAAALDCEMASKAWAAGFAYAHRNLSIQTDKL